jgi:hypothetical protein
LALYNYGNIRNLFFSLLPGACDVIFVEQPDGSYRSTPFHVRFGQLQPSKYDDGDSSTPSSVVDLTINGRRLSPGHVHIQLDKAGLVWLSKSKGVSSNSMTTEQLAAASRCLPMTANRALLPASTAVRLPSGLAAVIGPAASQLINTCADQLLNGRAAAGVGSRPVSPLRTGSGQSVSRPSPPCALVTPKEQLTAVNLRYHRAEQRRTSLKNSLSLSKEELVLFNLRRGLNEAILTTTSGLKGCNFKKFYWGRSSVLDLEM